MTTPVFHVVDHAVVGASLVAVGLSRRRRLRCGLLVVALVATVKCSLYHHRPR